MTVSQTEESTDFLVPEHLPGAIEANGINTISEDERKGKPRDLFLPWFASNVGVFGISYGAFSVAYGLSFWQGVIAGAVGLIISFVLVGVVAIAGPRGSAPTMILSRAAFGVRGNKVPAGLTWVLLVGWETVLVALGTLATVTVFNKLGVHADGAVKIFALLVISGLTVVGGVGGFDILMRMQGLITAVVGIATIAVMALSADHIHWSSATSLPGGSFESVIGVAILAAAGFGLGWVSAAADYSRYLPKNASKAGIFGWTTFGGSLGPVVLFVFGVLLASSSSELTEGIGADPVGALSTVLPTWFLVPFVIIFILGLVSATIMDIYSSGLALLSVGIKIPRYVAAMIDGVIMLLGATGIVFFTDNFLAQFQGFLITLGVPIAAWGGIMVADVILRRKDYATAELHDPEGRYGDVRVLPLTLMGLGTFVGWGMVTNSAAGWLNWQGYLLGMTGLGGKTGVWAYASIGVVVALLIGFLGTMAFGRGAIREQEEQAVETRTAAQVAVGT
jgi:nucleobase:cation symporter-1, NCS1 family